VPKSCPAWMRRGARRLPTAADTEAGGCGPAMVKHGEACCATILVHMCIAWGWNCHEPTWGVRGC
jgi:hypothetical protein